MASKKVSNPTHVAVRHIKHDGVYYAPSDQLALTDEQAEGLGDNVRPISAADQKADK